MSRATKVPAHARCHFCKRGNRQSGGLSLKSNLQWDEDRWYCRNTQDCINTTASKRPPRQVTRSQDGLEKTRRYNALQVAGRGRMAS